ncbi:MAG: hypothetical protein ACJ75F_02375, partial [Flavisolibacter sp.]
RLICPSLLASACEVAAATESTICSRLIIRFVFYAVNVTNVVNNAEVMSIFYRMSIYINFNHHCSSGQDQT